MKEAGKFTITRIAAFIGLLALVWLHAHWSVALSITVLWIASELRQHTNKLADRVLAELIKPSPEETKKAIETTVREGAIPWRKAK
jgi:hypothetical protein